MTIQDKIWFEKLYESRNTIANTLKDSFAIGNIWNSVVEKYSDQAHFIYELLQNADDVLATKAYFNLAVDGLYFTHNGKKNFWISNPDRETEDQIEDKLGDINAITAVAQSNKKVIIRLVNSEWVLKLYIHMLIHLIFMIEDSNLK